VWEIPNIHPWRHKAVRLGCDGGVAGIYSMKHASVNRILCGISVSFLEVHKSHAPYGSARLTAVTNPDPKAAGGPTGFRCDASHFRVPGRFLVAPR
jgi:hypothetical protein